jgi:predicted RND superfamily exporter protein
MSLRARITAALQRGEGWIFANPAAVLIGIFAMTLVFATQVPSLKILTDFNDLLPQQHPYIQTYNRIKENFGGANQVVMVIEAPEGQDVFNDTTLALVHEATQGVDTLPSINHNLISSLTHRTVRKVFVREDGGFASQPYYDAQNPTRTPEQLAQLRKDVLANPQVYGLLVSPDLKAALIKGQLNEGAIDYAATFAELQKVRAAVTRDGHTVHITGNPVLTGWVYTYLNQIVGILFWTLALLAALLVVYFRRLYGIALPLLGISLSSIWGLGFMSWLGFNLEPLSMPIPFLIAARAMSHGVQLVARYYEELAVTHDGRKAARNALDALFRPGSLAIIVDAVCIAVMMLGAAPFNWKLGVSAGFWAFSVIFTVHFMIPLALTLLPQPKDMENKNQGVRSALGGFMAATGGKPAGAIAILGITALLVVAGTPLALKVKIGESEPGSPILHQDHDYNRSTTAVNGLFPGSEELHIIARTKEPGGLKRPEVMQAIERFQQLMLADPAVGGVKAIPAVVRQVNRLTHNDDPRWAQLPDSAGEIGGLMFAYMASSPTPGALKEFVNADETEADLVFFYKDHQAETITRALALAEESALIAAAGVTDLVFEPGGGIVGVSAAANEALHDDHMIMVPMVMIAAFVLVMLYYQSLHAGWLMVLPMLFATIMTYAYMGWQGIGVSVNTVPVIMVGVGVGIDYAVYFMDRIREEMEQLGDIRKAAINAVATTGYAVSFTAVTLIAGVVLWIFMSDLRFQSDAAVLLSFMLIVNAVAAMMIVPAWCVAFRPRFVVGHHAAGQTPRSADAVA